MPTQLFGLQRWRNLHWLLSPLYVAAVCCPAARADSFFSWNTRRPVAAVHQPHPAVARITVPLHRGVAHGSGTLVASRGDVGLVITNWHVVRDAAGSVDVAFPNGFRTQGRPIKADGDWDLAAIVIWSPPVAPVKIAEREPLPGEVLTIAGYGKGKYRSATGRCLKFYAPDEGFPLQFVEVSVQARQGDSGGPIWNTRGELAGVLFGASHGTTLGSTAPRLRRFLASVAPDVDQTAAPLVTANSSPSSQCHSRPSERKQQCNVAPEARLTGAAASHVRPP